MATATQGQSLLPETAKERVEKMRQARSGSDSQAGTAPETSVAGTPDQAEIRVGADAAVTGGDTEESELDAGTEDEDIERLYQAQQDREQALLTEYQDLVQQRDQLQRDYRHAQKFGTQSSQEAAELRRQNQELTHLIGQYETVLKQAQAQMQTREEPYRARDSWENYPEEPAAEKPSRETEELRRQLAELQQTVQTFAQRESEREQERLAQQYLKQWEDKAVQWRTQGVTDENIILAAKTQYALGNVEKAAELVQTHLSRKALERVRAVKARQAAQSPLAESDAASGGILDAHVPKGGKDVPLSPDSLKGLPEWEQSRARVQHMMRLSRG